MKILSSEELVIVQNHSELFVEKADLREIYEALNPYYVTEGILLATAVACGYPFTIRYLNKQNHTEVLLSCRTEVGEYLLVKSKVDRRLSGITEEYLKDTLLSTITKFYQKNTSSVNYYDLLEILKNATYKIKEYDVKFING